jgi:CDP-glucose 4,6-dehydratase
LENMGLNAEFWRGKRVLVTGHTGFKGGWLSLWLQELGADVFGFALPPPTRPNFYEAAQVEAGMVSRLGDLREFEEIHAFMAEIRPDIVLHLAAQAEVLEGYADPLGTFATNLMGSLHVLEAARQVESVRALVAVSSDKCYENLGWHWGYRENDRLGGADPYSGSKACMEIAVAAYRDAYFSHGAGPRVATARAGNVIGGGDWAKNRLAPDLLRAFERGAPAQLRRPNAVRPWQHVLEPLLGYLLLAQALCADEGAAYAQAWNFGPRADDAYPVSWLADRLAALWGEEASWTCDAEAYPHEAAYLSLDASMAGRDLAWRPRWRLEDALRATRLWHGAWLQGEDMQAFSLAQIRVFQGEDA